MTQNRLKLTVIAVAIASALTGAYSASHLADVGNAHAASQPAAATLAAPVSAPLPDMSSIVAANGPAVVNISVAGSRRTADSGELPQLDPDDPFYEFFRHFRIRLARKEG